ncbi:MAG: hypothetical protein EBU23_17870 [Mycobacteriaceae bacterium]|nr:hypothetical protein [Mycobacteriaceae bacterium]
MSTKKTGWEALEKWVEEPGDGTKLADSSAKKTGWEALDSWVSKDQLHADATTEAVRHGDSSALADSSAKVTGWEALDHWVAKDGESQGSATQVVQDAVQTVPKASSGFFGWLKGLFGGK